MKRTIFWLLAVWLVTVPGMASASAENGNLEALRQSAQKGDVAAQYELGVLYEFGFNMPDNRAHALAWYMIAADGGNDRATKRRDLLQGQLKTTEVEHARQLRMEFKVETAPASTDAAVPPPAAEAGGAVPPAAPASAGDIAPVAPDAPKP